MRSWAARAFPRPSIILPPKALDRLAAPWYNDCVVNDKEFIMIVRKETLNEIATLKAKFNPGVYANWELIVIDSIAKTLNLAASDVAAAIKAWKL